MANSVTFPAEYGGSGITITDDADPQTGLDGTGYMTRFVPALSGAVQMAAWAKQKAVETNADRQQVDQDKLAVAADRQAVATDRAKVEADLQDAEARIGSTQELIDARDASLDAQAGAIDARTGAEAARDQTNNLADATAQNTATYASTAGGLAATVDGDYFRVMTVPTANEITVYRNDAGSATLIATYYTKGGVDERNAQATRLARSLQRLGDRGQTLHSDFAYGAYGLGSLMSGGVDQALAGEELFRVVRASPKWVWQPSGPNGEMRLTEVAPNTLARHWDPVTGEPLGALIEESRTNLFLYSDAPATQTITVTSGTAYTVSVIGSGSADLSGAGTGSATSETPLTFTASTTSLNVTITGSVDYCQVEEGSTASSMIITADASVTRAADDVSRTFGAEFNADGFTIFSNSYLADGAMLSLHNGTFDELIVFKISNSGSNLTIDFRLSGAPAGTYTRALEYFGGGISGSVALAISSSGSCVVVVNGVADTFSINAIPSVTTMQLSRSASGSVDQSTKAHYARIDAIPRALTDAELTELTS